MGAPRIVRFFSVTVVALLASAVGVQNALAQWTYRAAPQPLIRNISVFAGNPVTGTNTLIVSTLTDGMYKGTDTGTAITWQKISTGIPIVQVRSHTVITPSPATNPVTDIYAATDGAGLYKTIDLLIRHILFPLAQRAKLAAQVGANNRRVQTRSQ